MHRLPRAITFTFRNPFAALFSAPRKEQHLTLYVIREIRRGRPLSDVLEDPYVVNRTTEEQRMRLLDRPELVEAIGEEAIADLRTAVDSARVAAGARRPTQRDGVQAARTSP
jgi:hypothetical protein